MNDGGDQLYRLLPAIYRTQDARQGEPLRALFAILEEQGRIVEDDIATLYENWFIETCEEWVVPYLGDLVGLKGLHSLGADGFSQRARTANVLRYRRRKGTATMLEQLARDTTGWNAHVVELFERLGWTQHLQHIRPESLRTPDLRQTGELELLEGAFDRASHTVDVRRIAIDRGRYNVPDVGIFLWRLQSYWVTGTSARAATAAGGGRYTVSPAAIDAPLFNRPETETEITHLSEEINVPAPLRRLPLYEELEQRRRALVNGIVSWGLDETSPFALLDDGVPAPVVSKIAVSIGKVFTSEPAFIAEIAVLLTGGELTQFEPYILARAVRGLAGRYFDDIQPVLDVRVRDAVGGPLLRVPAERIMICDLSDWRRPAATKKYRPDAGGNDVPRPIQLSVDPVLGRLAFPVGAEPKEVIVSAAIGFSGDLGGGPYNRRDSWSTLFPSNRPATWQIGVSRDQPAVAGEIVGSLEEALDAWHLQPDGTAGLITIMDSLTYEQELTGVDRVRVPAQSRLVIAAAVWPAPRQVGRIELDDRRPYLVGDIEIQGDAESEFAISGLWLEGDLRVVGLQGADLRLLTISHCTLVPGNSQVKVNSNNGLLTVELTRSITGPVILAESVPRFTALESIIDRAGGAAVAGDGADITLRRCTVFGGLRARSIEGDGTIVTEGIDAARRQQGCLRFSYVPPGSRTPRRYRCQPDTAAALVPEADRNNVRARVIPAFTSTDWGQPGYAQLTRSCAVEIRTGAEDGSEMGAFGFLKQPQREANLRSSLDEYLRIGLEAGLIFVT